MADYIITLDDQPDFSTPKYNIVVNYEIPSKSTQYRNLILDDISSGFNGGTQTFALTVDGDAYYPLNDQQLLISVNDVLLKPVTDYQISGSNITFINAPTAGHEFSGIALITSADLTRTVNFTMDNGSFDIDTGSKGFLNIDVTGEIEAWTVVSDTVGNIAIDIKKTTYSNFPDGFTSIVGSEYPILTNQNKNKDEELTTWNKTITAGDILDFQVLSCSGVQKCSVFLRLRL